MTLCPRFPKASPDHSASRVTTTEQQLDFTFPRHPLRPIADRVFRRRPSMVKFRLLVIILFFSNLLPAQSDSWKVIADNLGRSGKEQPGGIYKVGLPRSDMHVTIDAIVIKPSLALGSWLAFMAHGANDVMVMGDLVLDEDEVGPVMQKLQQAGIEQTALH